MGGLDLDFSSREDIEEEDLDEILTDDFSAEAVKELIKDQEQMLKAALKEVAKNPKATRQLKEISDIRFKLLDWLYKHPDEPKDINLGRDFRWFREAVYEYVGPEGMSRIMAIYAYHHGTKKEKEKYEDAYKKTVSENRLKNARKLLISKWDKILRRRFLSNE
jgi:hypothetical protein